MPTNPIATCKVCIVRCRREEAIAKPWPDGQKPDNKAYQEDSQSGHLWANLGDWYNRGEVNTLKYSIVKDCENRMARVLYKTSVETSKLIHVIAYRHGVDEKTLRKLRGNVRRKASG